MTRNKNTSLLLFVILLTYLSDILKINYRNRGDPSLKIIKNVLLFAMVLLLLTACTQTLPAQESSQEPSPESLPVAESEVSVSSENGYGAIGALADEDLALEEMLQYAIEDEYLAHGEYVAITEAFGDQNPFSNIIKAELSHIAELENLYKAYDLPVPIDQSKDVVIVPSSITEALETGVQAEINNIAMYEKFLDQELPDDVKAVFQFLRDGSKNHLSAFENKL